VDPTTDLYRAPQLEIGEDDALFGPLKSTYQALLPAAAIESNVVAAGHAYDDDSSDNDYHNDNDDDDNYDNYDDYDDNQG
jgi:hypothetical protein